MKNLVLITVLMVSYIGQSQLNDYKYVIVPKKFNAFKKENQHRTSTLVKYLFSNKGFVTVYSDALPDELNANRCLGLSVELIDDSSMFTTKTALQLKDCRGKEVFLTEQGRSKSKDYEAAFNESIRSAFKSFDLINYSYAAKASEKQEAPLTVSFKNDVKTVQEQPKQKKYQDAMVKQKATLENQSFKDLKPTASNYKKADQVSAIATQGETMLNEQKAKEVSSSAASLDELANAKSALKGVLYAQELPNGGYQLVDSTPKIQLKLFKSSMPNVYVAKSDDKEGVVYTSDGKWFFEYNDNGNMVAEELNIKF